MMRQVMVPVAAKRTNYSRRYGQVVDFHILNLCFFCVRYVRVSRGNQHFLFGRYKYMTINLMISVRGCEKEAAKYLHGGSNGSAGEDNLMVGGRRCCGRGSLLVNAMKTRSSW